MKEEAAPQEAASAVTAGKRDQDKVTSRRLSQRPNS